MPFETNSWLTSAPMGVGASKKPAMLTTVPNFHGFGLGTYIRALCNAIPISLLNPERPVTASIVSRALDASRSVNLSTVPYVLKFFADMDGGVERLAALDSITVNGAAIPDDLGNLLIGRGCKINSAYGQTESGVLMRPYGAGLEDWNWYTPFPLTEGFLEFEKV